MLTALDLKKDYPKAWKSLNGLDAARAWLVGLVQGADGTMDHENLSIWRNLEDELARPPELELGQAIKSLLNKLNDILKVWTPDHDPVAPEEVFEQAAVKASICLAGPDVRRSSKPVPETKCCYEEPANPGQSLGPAGFDMAHVMKFEIFQKYYSPLDGYDREEFKRCAEKTEKSFREGKRSSAPPALKTEAKKEKKRIFMWVAKADELEAALKSMPAKPRTESAVQVLGLHHYDTDFFPVILWIKGSIEVERISRPSIAERCIAPWRTNPARGGVFGTTRDLVDFCQRVSEAVCCRIPISCLRDHLKNPNGIEILGEEISVPQTWKQHIC